MPPAFEVLLLNTAVPQIQAAQAGDTYVVPRDIAFSAALTLSAGTANGVPYLNGSKVLTTGSALTFNGSTLTVAPDANRALQIASAGTFSMLLQNNSADSGASIIYNTNGVHGFQIGGSEQMRLTSKALMVGYTDDSGFSGQYNAAFSGNVGIGTSSPDVLGLGYGRILGLSSASSVGVQMNAAFGSTSNIDMAVNGTRRFQIEVGNSDVILKTRGAVPLLFGTDNTERARITSGGYFKASNSGTYQNSTGAYHEIYSAPAAVEYAVRITNAAATTTDQYGADIILSGDPNDATRQFLRCLGAANTRAVIRSDGGLANYQSNNVDLSDIRTKTDINPVASYWSKIAGLEIVSYKYKDQTHDDLNIGVIAQQVEQVAPEFVDTDGFGDTPEDGVPLKTIYNKDLTFAAIKALQEAMARIETLEAEVAALKGN